MGNNAYKKEQAILHNRKRIEKHVESVRRIAGIKTVSEKRKEQRDKYYRKAKAIDATGDDIVLINRWEELAKVESTDGYVVKVDTGYSGWICSPEGDHLDYLSTHTFYVDNHSYSTRLLQAYGFKVTINNWDEDNER